MPVIEGYKFAVSLEDRGMARDLRTIKQEARALKAVMRANFAEIKNGEGTMSAYSQRIKDANDIIGTYKISIGKLQDKIKNLESTEAKNGASDKVNNQIAKNIKTIASYRAHIANLDRQMHEDMLVRNRAATGIDAFRKATEGVTTANQSLVRSLNESGRYYTAQKANLAGLVSRREALTKQSKAEIEVTRQLDAEQSRLATKYKETQTLVGQAPTKVKELTAQIEKETQAQKSARENVAEMTRTEGVNSDATSKATEKYEAITKKLDDLNKELLKYKEAPGKLQGLNDQLGKNAKTLANQAEAARKTSASLRDVVKASSGLKSTRLGAFYRGTVQHIQHFNQALHESTANTRKWWDESKSAFAGVGVAMGGLTAGAAKAISDATKVQRQYIEIKNLIRTSGESMRNSIKETNEMQQDGIKYSEKYGISQQEIGKQYEELVRRGYSGRAALGSMNSMLKAARASGDSFADVVKVTSSAVDTFGLRANNTAKMMAATNRVANAMASGADRTASGFKDMGVAMSYTASSAKTVGWDVEQTSAAIGMLSNRGIEGSQAGTGLRKVMLSLIEPTKNAQGALEKAGLSMDDFKTKSGKLKDVDQIFKLINQHVHGWSKTDQGAFFKDIFGTTGVAAAEALAQSAGGIKKNDDALTKLIHNIHSDEKTDYIGRLANKNMKSAQMQIARLKQTSKAFELSIGAALLPAVNKVGKSVAKWAVSKEGQRSMHEFSRAAGDVANTVARHTKDIIAFGSGMVDGLKETYRFAKPIISALGRITGLFDKSNKGSQNTARNLGRIVGIFGTATLGLKALKVVFGGVFAVSKDVVGTTSKFVTWVHGGTKAQKDLNTQLEKTVSLLEESVKLQKQYNGEQVSDLDQDLNDRPNPDKKTNLAGDIEDAVSTDSKEGKAVIKDSENLGKASVHWWQRGWLGKIGGFSKKVTSKLNPRNWTNTMAKLGDKAGQGFHLHFLKHIRNLGSKIKNVFKARSFNGEAAKLGTSVGNKFVKGAGDEIHKGNGKIRFSALFSKGTAIADEKGKEAGYGWARKFAGKIGDAKVSSKNWFKSLFQTGTDLAEDSGGAGGAGFIAKFAAKMSKGATILGGAWDVASAGIDLVKGIRTHNPDQRMRSYGGAAGALIGGGIGAAIGGPQGAVIGAQIGQQIGHALPEIMKYGKKAMHWFGKGWKNGSTWFHQLVTGDMKGVAKGWNNFWGKAGDKFDQTFGVDDGKHHKSRKRKKATVTSRIIHTGVHVSKKDVANVKAMSRALKKYAGSLKTVKAELKRNDPSKELNKVNKFLKSHTKQWTAAAGPIKKIGDAFKYLSKFAASVAKKDAFAAFNHDLPKLDSTLNKHGKSIKKGINDLSKALKGGKKNSLIDRFKSLGSASNKLADKLKALNSHLNKTASDFKSISKVTKEFTGKKNPLAKMATGFDKLKKSLHSDTHEIEKDIKSLNKAFKGKKGSNFADIISKAQKPLGKMSTDFKSMAKSMPPVSKGIKTIDKSIKDLVKGKKTAIYKVAKSFDTLKSHLKKDSKSIASSVKKINSAVGGKKGLIKRLSSATLTSKKLAKQFSSLATNSKALSKNLKTASNSLKTLGKDKSDLDKVSNSIKKLVNTIKAYPFGSRISSQAKIVTNALTGKNSPGNKFTSMASSVSKSTNKMNTTVATWRSKVSGYVSSLSSKVTASLTGMKSNVTSTFHSMWSKVIKDTEDQLTDLLDDVADAADAINDEIDSIDGDGSSHHHHHHHTVHLADGTIKFPTWAVLNDGQDSPATNNREGLLHANGILEYLKGRNITRLLLPGDEVIKASDMAKLPHFASGSLGTKVYNLSAQERISRQLLQAVKNQYKTEQRKAKLELQEKRLEDRTKLQQQKLTARQRNQQIRLQEQLVKLQQKQSRETTRYRSSRTSTRKRSSASTARLLDSIYETQRKRNELAQQVAVLGNKTLKISTAEANTLKSLKIPKKVDLTNKALHNMLTFSKQGKSTKNNTPIKGTSLKKAEAFNKDSHLPASMRGILKENEEFERKRLAKARKAYEELPKIYKTKSTTINIPRKNLDFSGRTVYLDSGYFSKSGKLTGKIIAVSKAWLKIYDKKQKAALRKIEEAKKKRERRRKERSIRSGQRGRSRTGRTFVWRVSRNGNRYRDYSNLSTRKRTTRKKFTWRISRNGNRYRDYSTSSHRRRTTRKKFTWRISKNGNRYRDYYTPVKRSRRRSSSSRLSSAISRLRRTRRRSTSTRRSSSGSSSISSAGSRVSASVSGTGALKSLRSLIKKIAGTHKAKIKVTYSGTHKAKVSINKLTNALKKLKKTKVKKIKVKYSGTHKAKVSIDKLVKSMRSIGSSKTLGKMNDGASAMKKVAKRAKSVGSSAKTARLQLKKLISSVKSASSHSTTLSKRLKTLGTRITTLGKDLKKNKFGETIKKQAEEAVKSLQGKGNFAKQFAKMVKSYNTHAKKMDDKSKTTWKHLQEYNSKGTSNISKVFNSFRSKYTTGWDHMESNIRNKFHGFWGTMISDTGKGINKVIDVLNAGISAIDHVVAEFGGNKRAVGRVGGVHYSTHLATGTGAFAGATRRAITKPTLAILNDGNDSPQTHNKETIWDTRSNTFGVVQGRNTPFLLQPGQEVLNATESRELGFTHFANGTGALQSLKELYKIAKHNWEHPDKTGNAMFKAVNGLSGAINQLAQGMNKKGSDQGKKWWSQLWKMAEDKVNDGSSGGDATGLLTAVEKYGHGHPYVWGATGPSAFDCSGLVMYALKKKFGINIGRTTYEQMPNTKPTKHPQPGDLVFFGDPPHHVGVYAGPNKYYSAQNEQSGIGMGRISAVTGTPHYRTVPGLSHNKDKGVNVKADNKLQKFIKPQVGKGFWRTIQKLADKYGDAEYGGNTITEGMVEAAARHMHVQLPAGFAKDLIRVAWYETGNRNINQHVHDINSGWNDATGPLQWTPQTWKGFAVPGHTNIHSPYDQVLAFFNNSDWRHSIGWTYIRGVRKFDWLGSGPHGHRRYANGGWANKPSIFAEAGPEMAIPLSPDKNSRSWELVGKTIAILSKQSSDVNAQAEEAKEKKETEDWRKQVLLLLNELLSKNQIIDVKFDIDGRKVFEGIKRYIKEDQRRTTLSQRRGLSGHF